MKLKPVILTAIFWSQKAEKSILLKTVKSWPLIKNISSLDKWSILILFSFTRLEIITDVVSEKARSGKIPIPHRKFRYHIGKTHTTSEIPIPHRFFPIPHRFFPIPYRYFRCGIGKNRCGIGISDVVSEFFRYVPFRYHIGNYF